MFICKVACGDHTIVALDRSGLIHCTGYNYYGELAIGKICDSIDAFQPSTELNKYLVSDPAIDISCRYYGVIVLTKSGKVYTTGNGPLKIDTLDLQERTFGRVLNIGANNSSFLCCVGQGNDLLIQIFESQYDDSDYDEEEIAESKTTQSLLIENGGSLLNSSERVVLVGSEVSVKGAALLCYIQSCHTESVLQNNLRKHLYEYVEEGRKSLADIIIKDY